MLKLCNQLNHQSKLLLVLGKAATTKGKLRQNSAIIYIEKL